MIPSSQATWLGGFLIFWFLVVPLAIVLIVVLGWAAAANYMPRAWMPYGKYVYSEQGRLEFDHYQISYNTVGEETSWRWPWHPIPTRVDRVRLSNPYPRDLGEDNFWSDGHRQHRVHGQLDHGARCWIDVKNQQHEVWQGPGYPIGNWLVDGGGLARPMRGEDQFARTYLSNFYYNQPLDPIDEPAIDQLKTIYRQILTGKPAETWEAPQVGVSIQNKLSYTDRRVFDRCIGLLAWVVAGFLVVAYLLWTLRLMGKRRLSNRVCAKLTHASPRRPMT